MKIYLDRELKNEVPILEGKCTLDLSIVDAGESKKYLIFVHNDHPYGEVRDLQLVVDNKEVKINKCPTIINVNESAECEIEWIADISVERGIKPNFKFKYNLICS